MKRIISIIIVSFSIIISIGISSALDVPANDGYILDQTNSLTAEQEQTLESKIYETRQTTDIEIGILIINSLEGEDIFNYSLEVAEARGVGDKEKDNGLFMLFAMEDRERRIQVGYGLEGIITDNIAKRFGERNIVPNFRAGLYFDGINNTLQDIIDYIEQDPTALAYINSENNSNNTNYNNSSSGRFNFIFIILLFILIKIFVIKHDSKKKKSEIKKKGRIALGILGTIATAASYMFFIPGEILTSGFLGYGGSLLAMGILLMMGGGGGTGGSSSGFGGFSSGGFSSGSSGGSSFGGFGGGSFGGGGGGGKR